MFASKEGQVIIDDTSLSAGIVHKETKLINCGYYWHKIFVKNATGCTKDFVLRAIMTAVHPHDFLPVSYTVEVDGQVSFLMKNCGSAIVQMCMMALTVPHPDKARNLMPFKLTILLKHAHATDLKMEMQSNVLAVLRKRYTASTKTLNLEQFYKDSDLMEFCPLSQQKLLVFVLHLIRDFEIDNLKLANNEIETLRPLEVCGSRGIRGITSIDLRKNNIKERAQLSVLTKFPLTELFLEDNPICDDFTEHEYLKIVRDVCPKLCKLDGLKMPPAGMLFLRRNYLINPACQDLVNRFLEHFFTLYDSPDRPTLQGLYHKNAMFSLTSSFLQGQVTSVYTRLMEFNKVSRNIKLISDLSRCHEMLFVGPQSIGNVFLSLPPCEHDPYTFTVDVTYHTEKMCVVVVTGVFKQPGINLVDREYVYGFTRTFVLTSAFNDEFNISNEQLHVFNASSAAYTRAFKSVRVARSPHIDIPQPKTQVDREETIEALMMLTDLKHPWAKKCLNECQYDLKRSLNLFVNLFKEEKLPIHAFSFKDSPKKETPAILQQPTGQNVLIEAPIEPPKPVEVKQILHMPQENIINVQRIPQEPPKKIAFVMKQIPQNSKTIAKTAIKIPVPVPVKSTEEEDAKDLKQIRDVMLLKALTLTSDLPESEIRSRLATAAKRVIGTYTFAIQYYRKIGRAFYKHGLFEEGRRFLSDGISLVPKHLIPELYVENILYEVEYGNWNIVDDLLAKFVKIGSIQKVINLLCSKLSAYDVEATSRAFEKLCASDLPEKDKQLLTATFKSFSIKYGLITEPSVVVLSDDDMSMDDEDNKATANNPKCPPQSHGNITPVDFWLFRSKLLKHTGMYYSDLVDDDVTKLREMTDPINVMMSLCDAVLKRHKSDYGVVRLVCKKFWSKKMFKKIRLVLGAHQEFVDKQLIQNLIVLYKLKTDAMVPNTKSFCAKLRMFITPISTMQLLNLLEDVMYEDADFAKEFFTQSLNDLKITNEKQKLIALHFKTYALLSNDDKSWKESDRYMSRLKVVVGTFHPNDLLTEDEVKVFMASFKEKLEVAHLSLYLSKNSMDLKLSIQVMMLLYMQRKYPIAREVRNIALAKMPNVQAKLTFSITSALFELRYGMYCKAKKYLDKVAAKHGNNPNVICALAECAVSVRQYKEAVVILNKIIQNQLLVMNPAIQKLLYNYFEDWKTTYKIEMMSIIIMEGTQPAT